MSKYDVSGNAVVTAIYEEMGHNILRRAQLTMTQPLQQATIQGARDRRATSDLAKPWTPEFDYGE